MAQRPNHGGLALEGKCTPPAHSSGARTARERPPPDRWEVDTRAADWGTPREPRPYPVCDEERAHNPPVWARLRHKHMKAAVTRGLGMTLCKSSLPHAQDVTKSPELAASRTRCAPKHPTPATRSRQRCRFPAPAPPQSL